MICLTRTWQGRLTCQQAQLGAPHAMKPVTLPLLSPVEDTELQAELQDQCASLLEVVERFPHILLDYDEITGGRDIREIPEVIGRSICEFLGVEYHVMTTKFYKPQRVA